MALLEKLAFEVGADLRPFATKMKEAGVVASSAAVRMGRDFDRVVDRLGSILTKATAVGAVIGGVAVKSAADFEVAMARGRTMTDLTNAEFEELQDRIRKSIVDFGITDFAVASEAFFEAFSTGATGVDDALGRIDLAFKNFVAQGTDAKTTLGFLAQQQAIFGESAGDNVTILDRLANATLKAQSNQKAMALGLAETAALAKAAGLSADEHAAALAVLTQSQGNASRAATAFKGLLNAVLTEQVQQVEIVDALNDSLLRNNQINDFAVNTFGSVEAALAANGKQLVKFGEASVAAAGGFFPFIENLAAAIQGSDTDTRRLSESMEGYSAILALTANQGKVLGEVTNFVSTETGRLEKQFGFVESTATTAFNRAIAQLKDFGLAVVTDSSFLEDLKLILVDGTAALADMTRRVQEFIEANPEKVAQLKEDVVHWAKVAGAVLVATQAFSVVADIVVVVAGAVGLFKPLLPVVTFLFSKALVPAIVAVAGAFGIVLSPIAAVVTAIVGLGAVAIAFLTDWDATWDAAKRIVGVFVDNVVGFWNFLIDSIKGFAGFLIDAITFPFKKAAEIVRGIWEDVLAFILSIPGVNAVSEFLGFKGGGFVPGFQHGGFVGGTGGTDSVLAKVTPREFIVKEPSASLLPPAFLESLNNVADTGQVPSLGPAEIAIHIHGMTDPNWVRETFIPILEEAQERGLSPRTRSVL